MPDVLCALWLAEHRLLPPTCQPRDAWAPTLQSLSQTPQSSVHMKIRVHKAPRVAPSIGFQNFLWMSFDAVAAAALSGSCLTGSSHLAFPGLSSSPQDLRLAHPILSCERPHAPCWALHGWISSEQHFYCLLFTVYQNFVFCFCLVLLLYGGEI